MSTYCGKEVRLIDGGISDVELYINTVDQLLLSTIKPAVKILHQSDFLRLKCFHHLSHTVTDAVAAFTLQNDSNAF